MLIRESPHQGVTTPGHKIPHSLIPGEENARRIAYLFDNNAHDLPNSERPDCHKDGTTYKSVYGRMHANQPAPTITTGIGTPGQGRFIHPVRPRMITPHEAARLQSFPDGYGFRTRDDVPRKLLAKWIGDAVPPFIGAIASGVALSHALGQRFDPPWR
jgi:DNA (cytosine-5)-methyltransferase 1